MRIQSVVAWRILKVAYTLSVQWQWKNPESYCVHCGWASSPQIFRPVICSICLDRRIMNNWKNKKLSSTAGFHLRINVRRGTLSLITFCHVSLQAQHYDYSAITTPEADWSSVTWKEFFDYHFKFRGSNLKLQGFLLSSLSKTSFHHFWLDALICSLVAANTSRPASSINMQMSPVLTIIHGPVITRWWSSMFVIETT